MAGQTLELNTKAGDTWTAKSVHLSDPGTPIALVEFFDGKVARHVRIDLDKRMFVDTPPAGVDAETAHELAANTVRQLHAADVDLKVEADAAIDSPPVPEDAQERKGAHPSRAKLIAEVERVLSDLKDRSGDKTIEVEKLKKVLLGQSLKPGTSRTND